MRPGSTFLQVGIASAALGGGVLAAPAFAGTYEVVSCAGAGGINRAWTAVERRPRQSSDRRQLRAVTGGPEDGLSVTDRIPGPPGTPAGREALWRVTAPPGARISRLTAQFYLGQFSAGEWQPFIRTAERRRAGQLYARRRTDHVRTRRAALRPIRPSARYQLDASGLEAGVRCAIPSGPVRNRRDAPSRLAGDLQQPRADHRPVPADVVCAGRRAVGATGITVVSRPSRWARAITPGSVRVGCGWTGSSGARRCGRVISRWWCRARMSPGRRSRSTRER